MANQFSNFNLLMLNLWIGLCRGEAGLPTNMRKLGYKERWIELEFQNSRGEMVKPELIITSNKLNHTLLLEWKGGSNTDDDQLRRYAGICPNELVQQAAVTPAEASSHDTCIVGTKENASRLAMGINQKYSFPLLAVHDDGVSLELNQFNQSELNKTFSPKLTFDISKTPTQLVPFDHNSEFWEIAERIIPQIIQYMTQAASRFTLDQLARECVPVWEVTMAPAYKKQLKTKIMQVVDAAAQHEFNQYFARDHNAAKRIGPAWNITYNPNKLRFNKRSSEYRKLLTIHVKFIEALRTGIREPRQLTLDNAMHNLNYPDEQS